MSVLPAGRSLHHVLPDLDELLADPRAYLAAAPLAFGPRRMYRLAALFAVPGVILLLSCLPAGRFDGERLTIGVALLIGAAVWLGWSLLLRGHEIVLHAEGVEVRHYDTTVWAPWAVFNSDGSAFVPDADSPRAGLTLPVAPQAVPFVELRRDGQAIESGFHVEARQWYFTARDEVVLPARYEVKGEELGELFLLLGRRLGRELPEGAPRPNAYRPRDFEAAPDPAGWITAPLTRLRFPPRCCDCGTPTAQTLRCQVAAPGDWLLGVLTQNNRAVELQVPVCADCQERMRDRQARGGARGMGMGAALAAAAAVALAVARGADRPGTLLLAALAGLAVGGLAGFVAGTMLAADRPVRLRHYSPARGTLALRFRNPEYAALVLQAMRARDADAEPRV
jgi:hypothetical protein